MKTKLVKLNKGQLRRAIADAKQCAKTAGKPYVVVNSSFDGIFDCDVLPLTTDNAKILFQTDGKLHLWVGAAMSV